MNDFFLKRHRTSRPFKIARNESERLRIFDAFFWRNSVFHSKWFSM